MKQFHFLPVIQSALASRCSSDRKSLSVVGSVRVRGRRYKVRNRQTTSINMFRGNPLLLLPSLWCLMASLMPAGGQEQSSIVQFHGSGTSNPARCYWHVLETMRNQIKLPTWTSYRSTSSGPGIAEFMGNITHPFTHFASADYPLPKEQFDQLSNAGQGMIHLPVLMGAVGIFHSVPLQKHDPLKEPANLNLTSCLVARIYKGEITDWTHPEITAINPAFDLPLQLNNYGKPKEDQSFPIKVAHRTSGSSSTYALTAYLRKSCPEHWEAELVGSTVTWPLEGMDSFLSAEGTSSMLATIEQEPGTIGYADSGLAFDEGLAEVALKMDQVSMKTDFFLTSKNALNKDGVSATLAAEGASIPTRGDVDWSGVDLINQVEGYIYAWPMVLMTYVFVRKDLPTFIADPRAQSLLVAFLKALYDPVYMQKCEEEFLFLPVKGDLRDTALESIDMLELTAGAPEWIMETNTMDVGGQGDFVISTKRQVSSAIEQEILNEKVLRAEHALGEVLVGVEQIQTMHNEMQLDIEEIQADLLGREDSPLGDTERRIDAGFAMGITSLVLWFCSAVWLCRLQMKVRSLEARPTVQVIQPRKKGHHHHHHSHDEHHDSTKGSDLTP